LKITSEYAPRRFHRDSQWQRSLRQFLETVLAASRIGGSGNHRLLPEAPSLVTGSLEPNNLAS
jgi:hypothetical protein